MIHQLWKPIPGRFKDYIAVPKSNQYQSLHTDVATPFDSILEVQIRTLDMHYTAKYGVAAHWRYKGTERDKKFDKRISWLEQELNGHIFQSIRRQKLWSTAIDFLSYYRSTSYYH